MNLLIKYAYLPLLFISFVVACEPSDAVNQPPRLTLRQTEDVHVALGSTVDVLASASDADGKVSHVIFHVNAQEVLKSSAAPHAYSFTPGTVGTFEVSAAAVDDQGATSETAKRVVHVSEVSELYELALTVSGEGSVTSEPAGIACPVTCLAPFESGQTVTLRALASENATFEGWDGACSSPRPSCALTPDGAANVAVSATFRALEPAGIVVTIDPQDATLNPGEARTFSASVTGDEDTNVTWRSSGGAITGTGATVTYTAPDTADDYTLTATSVADPGKKASASIRVVPPLPDIKITLSPESAELKTGEAQTFSAAVSGSDDKGLEWSATGGSIMGSGSTISYTAPAEAGDYTVTATSTVDPTKKANATVQVSPEVTITLEPSSADLLTGETQAFSATVMGSDNKGVAWSTSGGDIEGTSRTITYTAPGDEGDYTLTATSVADPEKQATVTIQVSVPPPVKVVAAGDIVCGDYSPTGSDKCHDQQTADLVSDLDPDLVLVLGDTQYDPSTYQDFLDYYDKSWGAFKAITRPAVGNHEYDDPTPNAEGYFAYFGAAAGEPGKGYYSFDVSDWHVVVLNTNQNCAIIACAAGSDQEQWLRADLAASAKLCTLAVMHHPRYNSGRHGSATFTEDLWAALYEAGTELVLAGHAHHYERFAPQDEDGARDDAKGLRSFVVGTGGKSLDAADTPVANSATIVNDTYGVLELSLAHDRYTWRFVDETGAGADDGSASCH